MFQSFIAYLRIKFLTVVGSEYERTSRQCQKYYNILGSWTFYHEIVKTGHFRKSMMIFFLPLIQQSHRIYVYAVCQTCYFEQRNFMNFSCTFLISNAINSNLGIINVLFWQSKHFKDGLHSYYLSLNIHS